MYRSSITNEQDHWIWVGIKWQNISVVQNVAGPVSGSIPTNKSPPTPETPLFEVVLYIPLLLHEQSVIYSYPRRNICFEMLTLGWDSVEGLCKNRSLATSAWLRMDSHISYRVVIGNRSMHFILQCCVRLIVSRSLIVMLFHNSDTLIVLYVYIC